MASQNVEQFTIRAENRFSDDFPDDSNSLRIHSGAWKFGFENLSRDQIVKVAQSDARPRFCSEVYGPLSKMSILELGPSDGYNTLGLEMEGAEDVTAIDGNVGAFLRCLTLKNYFEMKSKFLFGDFLKYLECPPRRHDLIYASGVLYHLTDPVAFLQRCAELCDRLFLWTFYYDESAIASHPYESRWFRLEETKTCTMGDINLSLYRRDYEQQIVDSAKYAGGFSPHALWLARDDLLKLFKYLGYTLMREVPDSFQGIPASNFLLERKGGTSS